MNLPDESGPREAGGGNRSPGRELPPRIPPEPDPQGGMTASSPSTAARSALSPPTLLLFGVPFHNVTEEEALAWIASRGRSGRASQLLTCNLDFILQAWKDPDMHPIHLEAHLVVPDRWPPAF